MQTSYDNVHKSGAYAKQFGETALSRALSEQPSHFGNVIIADFGLVRGRASQAKFDGVSHIVGFGGPFEVPDDVIRFDGVDVVDLGEVVGVRDECQCNKAVNEKSRFLVLHTQKDAEVFLSSTAISANAGLDDLFLAPDQAPILVNDDAIEAAHSAKITDLVEVSEVVDCNRSPFFRENDIHVAGCPSGNGGLAIKNPLHASTFGGFAIMTAASDNCNGRLQFR